MMLRGEIKHDVFAQRSVVIEAQMAGLKQSQAIEWHSCADQWTSMPSQPAVMTWHSLAADLQFFQTCRMLC
jgi:hypothetical protein